MNRLEKRALRLIKVGAENATPTAELAKLLNVTERRARSIVYRLVTRYGVPIIGGRVGRAKGLYIASNQAELLEGAKSLYNQNQEEQKRLTVLLNASLTDWQDYLKEG
ncbi:DNA-binding protein [Streptococcus hyointestinalis]|uniref:DNA-binding protein n=1 Tax=Streptococcus hyointestinalis TaxID=1337 RepID=UPI00240A2CE2|nr:DNA-binding protein [Streptococcus hyointestinalis]MDD6384548.1 DNA-binding protein [Streptococcus hyointestinalis]